MYRKAHKICYTLKQRRLRTCSKNCAPFGTNRKFFGIHNYQLFLRCIQQENLERRESHNLNEQKSMLRCHYLKYVTNQSVVMTYCLQDVIFLECISICNEGQRTTVGQGAYGKKIYSASRQAQKLTELKSMQRCYLFKY